MKEIRGEGKPIRKLLSGTRYFIDYYQREYKWQTKQVRELLDDLADQFLEDHKPVDDRTTVQGYGHYFLGSIIISQKNNQNFIIDGQQRLTTLTLLLIYLHNRQGNRKDRVKLDDLIFSEKFGKKSFNIDVDERRECMDALYSGAAFKSNDKPESIRNIVGRYRDIQQLFPEEIDDAALPFFADWLIENVHLVEITSYSDEDAYTIFETMNDRGLSLSPLDMLKGYILTNITDPDQRLSATNTWKTCVAALKDFEKEPDADADTFKAWLRSQYAQTIRERKRGAQPGDFDRLGPEFHRWVRDNAEKIGLKKSSDFTQFVARDLQFYTQQYLRLLKASWTLTPGLETVYYNAWYEFTLQYPLLLAPLMPTDNQQTIDRKLQIVSSFVDILITRRMWNFRSIAHSTMQYAIFVVMREIRGKSVPELVKILKKKLDQDETSFATTERFGLHQMNRYAVHQILARITDYVERMSGMKSRFAEFVAYGKNRYEIEHIWADHPERHTDEFPDKRDFADYRNQIGALLLLPKTFNASYGDLPYDEKLDYYYKENLLAQSLHPKGYKHNPGFLKFISDSKLAFQAHPKFKKTDLDARQKLYLKLAEEIWNPKRLEQEQP